MEINGIELGDVFLAPMAGVSEVGFRSVCKMAGADLTFTEMVNATALIHDSQKTKDLLITSKYENPKAVQIFGHNADDMAKVCASSYLKDFDLIDINFGCPAPKIVKNGDGSALLKDLKSIEKIVKSCVSSTNKPISCKFRKGFENDHNIAVQVAKICEEAGAKMITIHGRTREQMYSGVVDYETITKVKASVKIPVVGNGDIIDLNSYNKMKQTGVDAVMIGRGALGNPNLFADIKNNMPLDEYYLIEQHIDILRKYYDEKFVCNTMKKHLLWYISGKREANKYKLQIATSNSLDEALRLVKKVLEEN